MRRIGVPAPATRPDAARDARSCSAPRNRSAATRTCAASRVRRPRRRTAPRHRARLRTSPRRCGCGVRRCVRPSRPGRCRPSRRRAASGTPAIAGTRSVRVTGTRDACPYHLVGRRVPAPACRVFPADAPRSDPRARRAQAHTGAAPSPPADSRPRHTSRSSPDRSSSPDFPRSAAPTRTCRHPPRNDTSPPTPVRRRGGTSPRQVRRCSRPRRARSRRTRSRSSPARRGSGHRGGWRTTPRPCAGSSAPSRTSP